MKGAIRKSIAKMLIKCVDGFAAYPVKIGNQEFTFYVGIERGGKEISQDTKDVLAKNLGKCFGIAIETMTKVMNEQKMKTEYEKRVEEGFADV